MTDIQLYNTATRSKERFQPLDPRHVKMYVCGPTVYDRAHIGNARPVIVFDTLFRLLRHVYGENHVTYVRNFTDIDDKINARAARDGRSIREITDETTGWYLDDMAAVGALEPTKMPRATDWIGEMIAMGAALIEKGHVYVAQPPLFRVRAKRDVYYVQTDEEMKSQLLERGLDGAARGPHGLPHGPVADGRCPDRAGQGRAGRHERGGRRHHAAGGFQVPL